jgi:hypothetical protein
MITLTIKGSRQHAIPALMARNLLAHAEGFNHLLTDFGGILTQIRVADEHLAAVVDWMCELSTAPYPPGTVLLFTRVQE